MQVIENQLINILLEQIKHLLVFQAFENDNSSAQVISDTKQDRHAAPPGGYLQSVIPELSQ